MLTTPMKVADPVTCMDPVNVCVLAVEFPKILLPLEYSTEEDIVLTTKVWAVIAPVNKAEDPVYWLALTAPVVEIATKEDPDGPPL